MQDDERLAEELETYPYLYEKGNTGYKERDWEENACKKETKPYFEWPYNFLAYFR